MSQATKVEDADKKAVLSSRNKDGAGAAQGQTGAEGIAGTEENGLKQPPPSSSGPPVHDESQMDHPRGPLDEKLKFFLANLPPSVTALEMRRHFEAYGNVNFVKLIYNKATGVSMGYGFLYLMDEDTDRRVDEYSVRNNYRIRFANFSRIYLQRNDKTRTRPPRGDGKPFSGAHHRGDRPHDRPPPSTNGGRKPRRGNVVTELPSLRQGISNQPRLRHGLPPRPPPPLPRIEPPELWNRYPVEYRAQRAQPDHSAPHGYHQDSRSSNYEGCYFEQPQGPTSAEYYEDQQHPAVAYGQTDGYEASADYHHQHGYAEHGCGQQAHQGYGDQEHGYFNDDGHAGYYDGGGQYNEAGVYQQGEYYDGNHCSEPYAYPQQRGVARQAADHGYSRSQQYSAEPYQGTRDNTGYAHPGGFNDASYSYPQDGSHLQNHTHSSTAGHGSYQQSSGNYHGGTQGGYSHGGRGRGGGSAYAQRFQRRDRPY